MAESSEAEWVRRLLDVGGALARELDTGVVLDRLLEGARAITGARYAALGVLNDEQTELEQFLTSGIDAAVRSSLGDLPRGRGVLGELIEHPHALRLSDIGQHPSSYGFPAGHPPMHSFLGVPVVIRGRVWGNLYLTEKAKGDFTEADEEAALVLAEWAAIAIENARLYEASERARRELEKAHLGLEAIRDVAVAIGKEITLEHVLEIIVKRGRALVSAQSLVIMLRDGAELVVHMSAGHVKDLRGARLPISESTSGQVLERHRPERISDVTSRLRIDPREFGVTNPQTALLVPMVYRGRALGILAAFDRGPERDGFTDDDEEMLRTFAASAATAVALAQSVQADRLHSSLVAGEVERSRWARELHDETLQGLGGLRLLLSSALRGGDPERGKGAMEEAVCTSSARSRTCARSSRSCAPQRLTSWVCAPPSKPCLTATAISTDFRSRKRSPCPDRQRRASVLTRRSRAPSTGWCRRLSRTSSSIPRRTRSEWRSVRRRENCLSKSRTTAWDSTPRIRAEGSGCSGCRSVWVSPAAP